MSEPLRDTIAAAVEDKLGDSTPAEPAPQVETPAAPQEGADKTPAGITDTKEAPKGAGRTLGRKRDDNGRLLPGPADPALKAQATQPQPKAPEVTPAPAAKPRYTRPSTWRKETWGVWDKLNANQPLAPDELDLFVQEAIRRDSDFARGVATYKQEWDTAKPLIDAMAPFMPLLQQHNIAPQQWITNLGNAHRMLAMGSPHEKAQRFAQLAREYGVPLEQVFTVGQDGRLYVNQNLQGMQQQPMQQQQPQGVRPEDIDARIEQRLLDRQSAIEIDAMARDAEKYPHFSEVRETMAGLLQAGLADGLEDAYQAALRHPRHAQLFEAMQEQQRQADEQRVAEEKRKAAEAARRKTASVRSATPTSPGASATGKQSLRDTITANAETVLGGRM